jgi:hypothetical protein
VPAILKPPPIFVLTNKNKSEEVFVTGKMKFFMKFLNPYGLVPVPVPAVSTLSAIAMTGDPPTAGTVTKMPPRP